MASTNNKLVAAYLIFSFLVLSPICEACCGCTPPSTPTPATPTPATPAPATPTPATPATPAPATPTPATPSPSTKHHCPKNTLKLGVCADVLGLVHAVLGNPPSGTPCCTLLKGLADLEAAACLCTALKAKVLGLNLNIPISLSLILSACQKSVPEGYKCQ